MRADGSQFPVELTITRIPCPARRRSPATCATSRTHRDEAEVRARGRGSSRRPTSRGVAWSATSTTAPSSGWSSSRSTCGWPGRTPRRRRRSSAPSSSTARSTTSRTRWASCASSRAGIHPAALTEGGLRPALEALAAPLDRAAAAGRGPRCALRRARSRRPRTSPSPRRSPTPRATPAARAGSRWRSSAGDEPAVEVRDDGRGGADPTAGLGPARARRPPRRARWRLEVTSPPGAGTSCEGDPVRVVIADDAVLCARGRPACSRRRDSTSSRRRATRRTCCGRSAPTSPTSRSSTSACPPTTRRRPARGADDPRGAAGRRFLLLSQYVEDRYLGELLAGGAEGVGYLLKDRVAEVDRLSRRCGGWPTGGSVLDPEVVARMLGRARASGPLDALTDASARCSR